MVTEGKARVSDSNSFRGGRGATVNGWTERGERVQREEMREESRIFQQDMVSPVRVGLVSADRPQ